MFENLRRTVSIGAIIGDIVGSIYEGNPVKSTEFSLFGEKSDFTDDTVLTIATAHSILEGVDYATSFKHYGRKYTAGYGSNFYDWLYSSCNEPYNSWGNGSAMRVSPVGFAFDSVKEIILEARSRIPEEFSDLLDKFNKQFNINY